MLDLMWQAEADEKKKEMEFFKKHIKFFWSLENLNNKNRQQFVLFNKYNFSFNCFPTECTYPVSEV